MFIYDFIFAYSIRAICCDYIEEVNIFVSYICLVEPVIVVVGFWYPGVTADRQK